MFNNLCFWLFFWKTSKVTHRLNTPHSHAWIRWFFMAENVVIHNSKFVIKERFEKLTSVIFYFQYRLMIRAKFIVRRKLSDCSNDSPFHVFIELSWLIRFFLKSSCAFNLNISRDLFTINCKSHTQQKLLSFKKPFQSVSTRWSTITVNCEALLLICLSNI